MRLAITEKTSSAVLIASFFYVKTCNSIVFRYFVASQCPEMRAVARRVPGTPVLYLHESAPTLEKPSGMSREAAHQAVEDR